MHFDNSELPRKVLLLLLADNRKQFFFVLLHDDVSFKSREKRWCFEVIFSKFDPFASGDSQKKASCSLKNFAVFVSTLKTKN